LKVLALMKEQSAPIFWRFLSSVIILFVWGFGLSIPLADAGLGITVLWWLIGVPVYVSLFSKFFPKYSKHMLWVICTCFGLDLAAQLIIVDFFGAVPNATTIGEAIANTNQGEVRDFLLSQADNLVIGALGVAIFLGFAFFETRYVWPFNEKSGATLSRRNRGVTNKLRWASIFLVMLLHLNPTMLRGLPLSRFVAYWDRYQSAQEEIQEISEKRSAYQIDFKKRVSLDIPTYSNQLKVIVIGESSNRDNWSLYGYPRDTTEPLDRMVHSSPRNFSVYKHAYSTEAFTMQSLTKSLLFSVNNLEPHFIKGPDIFQIAQQAGYRITWLSNQLKGEGWFSAIANSVSHQTFINNGSWHDSSSTDIELIPYLEQTLKLSDERPSLVVLHVLGQHFYYEQRCPNNVLRYNGAEDYVTTQLAKQGRSSRTIRARNAYDSAIHCGAQFLSQVINQLEKYSSLTGDEIELLYFSDHGQEVGHNNDTSSHSAVYESGYKIPLFIWHSRPKSKDALNLDAYFELDQLPSTLIKFLGIKAPHLYKPQDDLMSDTFVERDRRQFPPQKQ